MALRQQREPRLDPAMLRRIEKRVSGHGFDGRVRMAVDDLAQGVAKALHTVGPSLVIVDDSTFDALPGRVPLLVVQGTDGEPEAIRVIADGGEGDGVAAEVTRRLARGEPRLIRLLRRTDQRT